MSDVRSPITGTVWKVEVQPGQAVTAGQVLMILESMKMEIPIEAPSSGTVGEVRVQPEEAVKDGDVLATIV